MNSILQPKPIAAIFAAVRCDDWLRVSRKFFRSLPKVRFCVTVCKRKIASLIVLVRRRLSPNLARKHRKNAVVDASLVFIDQNEGLG